jgi:hypothetical protein
MSLEDATVSSMWEIASNVEVLERMGRCTKHDLYDIITKFCRMNPRASIPEIAFPEPYLLTDTENKIIDDIQELLEARTDLASVDEPSGAVGWHH